MKAEPTPAPWIVEECNTPNGKGLSIIHMEHPKDEDEEPIIDEIADVVMDYAPGVAEANANLLAAAPHLLLACRHMMQLFEEYPHGVHPWSQAQGMKESILSHVSRHHPPHRPPPQKARLPLQLRGVLHLHPRPRRPHPARQRPSNPRRRGCEVKGNRLGMGGHQRTVGASDEWLTPPEILAALGQFDLDPCAPIERPWEMAGYHMTVRDNGLHQEWWGRVWLNPPYGLEMGLWLKKLAMHGDGIALIFARTETATFFKWGWQAADAMLFLRGRLFFYDTKGQRAKGSAGAPSVLIAYGQENAERLRTSGLRGQFIPLGGGTSIPPAATPAASSRSEDQAATAKAAPTPQ